MKQFRELTAPKPPEPTVIFKAKTASLNLEDVYFEFTMPEPAKPSIMLEIMKWLIGADLLKTLAGHETSSDFLNTDTPF